MNNNEALLKLMGDVVISNTEAMARLAAKIMASNTFLDVVFPRLAASQCVASTG